MSRAKSLDLYLIEGPERMVTSAPWDWAVSTEIMLGTSPDIWGTQTLRLEEREIRAGACEENKLQSIEVKENPSKTMGGEIGQEPQ